MPQFWDCSIIGELNNLGNTIDLISECQGLGYHGVVLNYIINTADHEQEALHAFMDDDYQKIVEYFRNKIRIRTRCTLDLMKRNKNDSKSIDAILSGKSNKRLFDKFDILSVRMARFYSDRALLESVIKCKGIGIINLDHTAMDSHSNVITNTSFKQLIRTSKANGKYFEVSLHSFRKNIKNVIFTVNFIGSVIGGINSNLILSTSASKKLEANLSKKKTSEFFAQNWKQTQIETLTVSHHMTNDQKVAVRGWTYNQSIDCILATMLNDPVSGTMHGGSLSNRHQRVQAAPQRAAFRSST